jgi:hypothetical protein
MLKAAQDLKEPLTYISNNTTNNEYKKVALRSIDWLVINTLVEILEVFVKPSIKLQGQVYITLPNALLYIFNIYNKLYKLIQKLKLFQQKDKQNVSCLTLYLTFYLYLLLILGPAF